MLMSAADPATTAPWLEPGFGNTENAAGAEPPRRIGACVVAWVVARAA
ncbi:hypothetical protein ACFVT2_39580 [Streptomyces sp. NPDC058000]